MTRWNSFAALALVAVCGLLTRSQPARGVEFTSSYSGGVTTTADCNRTLYAQGFSPFINDGPDPGHQAADTVSLSRFQFFKSTLASSASNVQLAIISNYFMNLDGFSTTSAGLVGLSTNTIASTAGLAPNDPITFNFSGVNLTYAAYYAAVYVTRNLDNTLTPVLVSTLSTHYAETPPGSGAYVPATNYGDQSDFMVATSNFIFVDNPPTGHYLRAFDNGGDANFKAYYDFTFTSQPGDYNGDSTVNAADYTIWRDTFGSMTDLRANGDDTGLSTGKIDQSDFTVWLTNFGLPHGSGGLEGSGGVVPEPCSLLLAAVAAAVLGLRRTLTGRH